MSTMEQSPTEIEEDDMEDKDEESPVSGEEEYSGDEQKEEGQQQEGDGVFDGPTFVKRVLKIFSQVAESLEDYELNRYVVLIKSIIDMDRDEDNSKLETKILEITEMVLFRRGLSVNVIKQAVRCLIEIKEDKWLANEVWQVLSGIAAKLTLSIQADFGGLDPETQRKYHELLKEGSENVRHIRLMVVGMFGVGKTTIIRRMCGEGVENVVSTKGIDVSVNACEIDDDKKWKVTDIKAKSDKKFKNRMNQAYRKMKKEKPKESEETSQKAVPETTPVDEPERVEEEETDVKDNLVEYEDTHYMDEYPQDVNPISLAPFSGSFPTEQKFGDFTRKLERASEKKEPKYQKYLADAAEAFDEEDEEAEKRTTTVSIWDFAGQSIYYSTHHFFLSGRAIYLLVLNISEDLNTKVPENICESDGRQRATSMPIDFTCLDAFKFWMNSIYTYIATRIDQDKMKYRPTIVLVGTFKDKVKNKYEDKCKKDSNYLEKYKNRYFDEALKSFTGTEVIKLVHKKKFFVSKVDPEGIFDELKEELYTIAEKQPFWDEIYPLQFLPLERSIEIRKGDRLKKDEEGTGMNQSNSILELQELEQIDQGTEYTLNDRDLLKVFLQYQHAFGNVLFYDTMKLENTIILDPQWILNVFKLLVVHDRDGIEKDPLNIGAWEKFEEYAILSQPLIDDLVDQNKDETMMKYKKEIKDFMEYLDVIAKPVAYAKSKEEQSSEEEDDDDSSTQNRCENLAVEIESKDYYIVPCLLSHLPSPGLQCQMPENAKMTPILCLVFKNKFLPAFLCHRLMATCIREWEVDKRKDQRMLYNGMGRFLLDSTRTFRLTIWWKDHILYFNAFLCTTKGRLIDGKTCSKVRLRLMKMIREISGIHRNYGGEMSGRHNVVFDEFIKCPKCISKIMQEHLSTDKAEAKEKAIYDTKMLGIKTFDKGEVMCDKDHIVNKDAALSCWFFEKNEREKEKIIFNMRKQIFEWLQKNKDENELDDRHFAELSEYIGREYIALGIELGLNMKTIERIDEENRNIKVRITKILEIWARACEETPTFGLLKESLLNIFGLYEKKGRLKDKRFDEKAVVKWFEAKAELEKPSEKDLLQVAHFIKDKKIYRRVAKILFTDHNVKIEQIEDQYSLDFTRALVVLLKWQEEQLEDEWLPILKKCVTKVLKIDWEKLKQEIAEDLASDDSESSDDDDFEDAMFPPDMPREMLREYRDHIRRREMGRREKRSNRTSPGRSKEDEAETIYERTTRKETYVGDDDDVCSDDCE